MGIAALALCALLSAAPSVGGQPAGAATPPSTSGGPAAKYDCSFNVTTDAFTGAYGTASAIGWEGNHQGVVTCLGGTFLVQDDIYKNYGFGIYNGARMTWADADGYLPAQVTSFTRSGAHVAITEFCDRVVVGGNAFVAVYARVQVANPTATTVTADPDPSPGLVPLDSAPDAVGPHRTVDHDYVVAADRFGNDYPWPSDQALAAAGGFTQHFSHMKAFWDGQLAGITRVDVPNPQLVDAYRAGFTATQIARSGNDLNTGVNGYAMQFSHDVIGILTNLFNQGYFTDAHTLLLDARGVMLHTTSGYNDGEWTYPLPWAIYLMKTGDLSFVEQNFAAEGPTGPSQPSIEDAAHAIAADRTGPGGIMESTDDIDSQGYWTTDDFEALTGLAAYRYLAQRIGDTTEATWASQQYAQLLAATNATLRATIARYHLHYLPCSMVQPNTQNRCVHPKDANWTSPFGFGGWAWETTVLGAPRSGPGLTMIDATYAYGIRRLRGVLPADTFGGFPDDYYSSAYNAATGVAGLAGERYRDQSILNYEFMIENGQSGPNSWWESSGPPGKTPWVGRHPVVGQGSSPHAWGMAGSNTALLDSLVTQRTAGSLVVGRGVPDAWLAKGSPISVANFPSTDGHRIGLRITTKGTTVSLSLSGTLPTGPVLFELPAFVHDIASASTGTVDDHTGTVTLKPHTTRVTVTLRSAPVG